MLTILGESIRPGASSERVHALPRIAIAGGGVAASVRDAAHRSDAQLLIPVVGRFCSLTRRAQASSGVGVTGPTASSYTFGFPVVLHR
jgi:hypothetical protein